MIKYLTAKTCEVSTAWSRKSGARLRQHNEVRIIYALTLLTPGLKSLSEVSSTMSVQCAPMAVRESDGTLGGSQA